MYDYSDSEFSNDGEVLKKRRWQLWYPRSVIKPIKRLRKRFKQFDCRCTCDYIVDPHGELGVVIDTGVVGGSSMVAVVWLVAVVW